MFSFGSLISSNGWVRLVCGVFVTLFMASGPVRSVVIEDWMRDPIARKGIPSGWTGESFGGRALYDFTIEQDGGRQAGSPPRESKRALHHLKRHYWQSKLARNSNPGMDLEGDRSTNRRRSTAERNDRYGRAGLCRMAAISYTASIPDYVWDTTTPMTTIAKSQKTGTVTFVVVRSGSAELGKWLMERRNVAEDYTKIFGESPDYPRVITISSDSNDTRSMSEFSIGTIAFRPG